ncbi:MAG: DUF736 domain-containing protein [Rhodobiaceae bacterium]|nr:DUF736 domain-containing protein [Rhodobiaceae bacterium]
MIIGRFIPKENGDFEGWVETMSRNFELLMQPEEGTRVAFRIYKGMCEVGQAFEKCSNETGKTFYSVRLDDPFWEKPLNCLLFEDRSNGGWNLVFKREPRKQSR